MAPERRGARRIMLPHVTERFPRGGLIPSRARAAGRRVRRGCVGRRPLARQAMPATRSLAASSMLARSGATSAVSDYAGMEPSRSARRSVILPRLGLPLDRPPPPLYRKWDGRWAALQSRLRAGVPGTPRGMLPHARASAAPGTILRCPYALGLTLWLTPSRLDKPACEASSPGHLAASLT